MAPKLTLTRKATKGLAAYPSAIVETVKLLEGGNPLTQTEMAGLDAALNPMDRFMNRLKVRGLSPVITQDVVVTRAILRSTRIPARTGTGTRRHLVVAQTARPVTNIYIRRSGTDSEGRVTGGVEGPLPKGVNFFFHT